MAAITHNQEIDDAAVELGLQAGCFYVGVLGSRRTFQERCLRLSRRGVTEEELRRVHGPIGLDIGAESPEEIALSIAAEMVREFRQSQAESAGTPLSKGVV